MTLGHAIEHIVVAGAIGFPIIGWLLGSLVRLATRESARSAPAWARASQRTVTFAMRPP